MQSTLGHHVDNGIYIAVCKTSHTTFALITVNFRWRNISPLHEFHKKSTCRKKIIFVSDSDVKLAKSYDT